ncbi:MarR family transcriptional regulator [archaeon]|nr:MAG: MarR family transcriptional regulator [archaeon]
MVAAVFGMVSAPYLVPDGTNYGSTMNQQFWEIPVVEGSIFINNPIPFAFRINYLANFFTEAVYRRLMEEHGVARSEFVVIFCLKSAAGELSAQDICAITGRPKNSVSRAVNSTVEGGYVERRLDPDDARRSFLSLTRRGEELYKAALPIFRDREQAMLEPLTARDRQTLMRVLDKLIHRDDAWSA